MNIASGKLNGRKTWELDNGFAKLAVMVGGGHIAGLRLKGGPAVNPFWIPIWKSIEPWTYRPAMKSKYGLKLLAAISGHNLCLGAFGDSSPDEMRAGLSPHGEAPVLRWKMLRKKTRGRSLSLACGCDMPIAQMQLTRTITSTEGSAVYRVREQVRSLARRDAPFTMCEHVTFGPPFLEKGVTVFDMPATLGHTHPAVFGDIQRMRRDTAFRWPAGPGAKGKVDLRMIGSEYRKSSDFSTQLMDPAKELAWFSAVNPRLGLLVAYVWKRSDFPWIGNWEENHARKAMPWAGRSFTRGMEFANTPFPIGLRPAVSLGTFQGETTYRWLPALGTVSMEFSILAAKVGPDCAGVSDIRPVEQGFAIDWICSAGGRKSRKTLIVS